MRREVTSDEDEVQTLLELLSLCKYDCDMETDCMTCLSERINVLNAKWDHAPAIIG